MINEFNLKIGKLRKDKSNRTKVSERDSYCDKIDRDPGNLEKFLPKSNKQIPVLEHKPKT